MKENSSNHAMLYIDNEHKELFIIECRNMNIKYKFLYTYKGTNVYYIDFILPDTVFKLGMAVGNYRYINTPN